jgi:hypothetical protein
MPDASTKIGTAMKVFIDGFENSMEAVCCPVCFREAEEISDRTDYSSGHAPIPSIQTDIPMKT